MTYYDTSDTTAIDPRSDEPRAAEAAVASDPGKQVRGLTYCPVLWQGRFSAGIVGVGRTPNGEVPSHALAHTPSSSGGSDAPTTIGCRGLPPHRHGGAPGVARGPGRPAGSELERD